MTNSNQSDKNRKSTRMGYYIALSVCIFAIGISSYAILSTASKNREQASVSAPLTATAIPDKKAKSAAAIEQSPKEAEIRKKARSIKVTPVKGEIIRAFSDDTLCFNPTTHDWRLHEAVDFAAEGQKVCACMAGRVVKVYDDDFLGTSVVIRHDGGYESCYSNLTAMPTVKVGDEVAAGDIIGAVGDTAILESADPPHLHFSVNKDGKAVDPEEFLKGK